ncbi:MAG: alpha/beta hydrolase [Beijerinckiaceae bacterium]|jgi:pimeloyl-ACP methyl ester carboxylesterase
MPREPREISLETATPEGESLFYAAPDGLRLHLRDYDPGPADRLPAVCLPGLTRNADDFAPLARALACDPATPRRVVAFDYRGRGLSAYDPDWRNYNLTVERGDILAGLALLGFDKAHFIGTSRGGLQILSMSAEYRTMFQSIVLNDIGPVLEIGGLARIKSYIGSTARPRDCAEAIALLKAGPAPDFPGLSPAEWRMFAAAVFGPDEANLAPRYDPELAHALDSFDLEKPLPDLWPQFDALSGLPLLTIRGETSDLLSPQTFGAMGTRWPGCEMLEVPGQGHAPLLADSRSISTIAAFLARAD